MKLLKYRHEWKHQINLSDLLLLRARLSAITGRDTHAKEGTYQIRSLYFDNPADKALREKLDGVNNREKFRIRYYNGDPGLIRLEKKSKTNNLCLKQSTTLTPAQARSIAEGRYDRMSVSPEPLIQELYSKIMSQGLRPKVIVDYIREPFVYAPGNVRITLDYEIRTGLRCTDFLNPDCVTIPVPDSPIILEVKWDEYLPDIIRKAVGLTNRSAGAFSKYAACRMYD